MSHGEPVAATPLAPGQLVEGKYRVVRPLGEGAMGLVYEGYHERLEKPVAIKVLRPEIADDDGCDRFEAEARAAAAVGHPNIVAVTDLGRTPDGLLYFVMDLLKGETLGRRLERYGKVGVESAVTIAVDVLDGLAALHALALIHRDIKPDNVFLARPPAGREIAKILDFGISKATAGVARRSHGTQVGMAVGTPHYMAPEQAMAVPDIDGRADVWAMGVVLYEMLAGRRPFDADDALGVLNAVVTATPAPLGALCPQAPPALIRVIEAAMSKPRQRRPATAAELASKLKAAVGHGAVVMGAELAAVDAPGLEALDPAALNAGMLVDLAGHAVPPPAVAAAPAPAPARIPTAPPETRAVEEVVPPAAIPPERPQPRRPPLGIIAGAVAAALLVFALVRWKAGGGPSARHAAEGAAPGDNGAPGERALVHFEVTPATTRVFLDGLQLPSNPVSLAKGERHIVTAVADGYQMVEQEFQVREAMVLRLTLQRERDRRR